MKILVISPVFPPRRAGEAEYALHLCERLAARGVEVELLTDSSTEVTTPPGVRVLEGMGGWGWSRMTRLIGILRRTRPDGILLLYIGWLYEHHPMITYLPMLARRWLKHVRIVTLFYNRIGAAYGRNSWLTRGVRKLMSLQAGPLDSCYEFGTLLTSSDGVIVLTEKHGEWLSGIEPGIRPRLELVPSLPCLRMCETGMARCRASGREMLGIGEDELVVAFFGFVYPSKRIDVLFPAFRKLLSHEPRARLVVIGGTMDAQAPDGESYYEELCRLARELGIDNKITWTGSYASDSDEASRYLHAADIAALPFEVGIALNNSSLAAVAWHGLPIVSTEPSAALERAFVPGENVLLCPPNDADALAVALRRVASDPDLRRRLSAGARRLAEEWFSWDKATDTILEALQGPVSVTLPAGKVAVMK